MHTVHASMMDAVNPRQDEPGSVLEHLAAAAWPDRADAGRTALPLLPARRAWALQAALVKWFGGLSAQALQIGGALPALAGDGAAAAQGLALAEAALDQILALQTRWLEGVTELGQEMGQVRPTQTWSKYVYQEATLVQQAVAMVLNQATAAVQTFENIQISTAWWLSRRAAAEVRAPRGRPSSAAGSTKAMAS